MKPAKPIYMDYQATTPVDPEVVEAMLPYFFERFGNSASSAHAFGWDAKNAVEKARRQVAALMNAEPDEVLFTSCASESNNLVIKGIFETQQSDEAHIVTTLIEHKSVIESCRRIAGRGARISYLPVDPSGKVVAEEAERAIGDHALLASIIHSSNEIGTVQDLASIGAMCHERGVLLHTDATQSLGKIPFDVKSLDVDMASFSAHKLYGPKGVGALYIRKMHPRIRLTPQIDGGGQEKDIRSGTLNVPGIVGFGMAAEVAQRMESQERERLNRYRSRMIEMLTSELEGVHIHGHPTARIPGNLSVRFDHVTASALISEIKTVAFTTSSACNSGSLDISYVLKALGLSRQEALGAVRLSIGRFTTDGEIDYVCRELVSAVRRLRADSPLVELAARGG